MFSIIADAVNATNLTGTIEISSKDTRAEAYKGRSYEVIRVHLGPDQQVADAGFQLLQNIPNPFTQKTTIGYVLPEAMDNILIIYDQNGKVLRLQVLKA